MRNDILSTDLKGILGLLTILLIGLIHAAENLPDATPATARNSPAINRRPRTRCAGDQRSIIGPNRPSSSDRPTKMESALAAEAAGVVRRAAAPRDKVDDRGSGKFGREHGVETANTVGTVGFGGVSREGAAPRPQNVANLMDALRRSIAEEKASSTPPKKARKRIEGQGEMLLPIAGKAKKVATATPSERQSAGEKNVG